MELSNFQLQGVEGTTLTKKRAFATVEVTTGMLWWKKTTVESICREYGGHWFFVVTGKYTPGYQAEQLERAWEATNKNIFD